MYDFNDMHIDLGIFYFNLLTMALIVVLGIFLGKKKWIDERVNRFLTTLVLSVTWPCALFNAFPDKFHSEQLSVILWAAGGGLIIFAITILLANLVFRSRKKPTEATNFRFAYIFADTSFLGFPLVTAAFGTQGLAPYAGFIFVFCVLLFSYGVMMMQKHGRFNWQILAKAALNPNIIAVILGAIFFTFSWKLPTPIGNSVNYVGAMTTPLALICIGYMLSRVHVLAVLKKVNVVLVSLLSLVVRPAIALVICKLFNMPPIVTAVLVLMFALPAATSLALFARRYDGNTESASELVVVGTVLSAATVPLVMWLASLWQ